MMLIWSPGDDTKMGEIIAFDISPSLATLRIFNDYELINDYSIMIIINRSASGD